jgi:pimeloyl-ACP methyl ester carboxylesterase
MMIEAIRTPEERFNNLPNFPFKPNYIENLEGFEELRMHFLDEGPQDAEHTFLCLHGQPTWSYLYRKMIPVFVSAGHRVIAPDWFGFGKSDKPLKDEIYTFEFHRNSVMTFLKKFKLTNLTLVCQDWGGLIGLTLPMDLPGKFSRMIIMNTALAIGDISYAKGFLAWRQWSEDHTGYDIARLLKRACPHLSEEERQAYNAPFPDAQYRAGLRRFPIIVPDNPDLSGAKISQRAQKFLSEEWSGPVFMAIGMQDPVLGPPVMKKLKSIFKSPLKRVFIREGGHFLQEWGERVAKDALEYFSKF